MNSDCDKFLSKVRENIDTELRKFGLYLMNINISDIRDAANYIVNLGKEAESKALNEAQANIEEQEKLGAIKIANQIKERETKMTEPRNDQDIALSNSELAVTQADADKKAGEAAARSEASVQYKMVDQWKEIAGEQVKAFEHINLGNITVFDGGNGATGNFLNQLVKTVAPSLGVLDKLPIGETVKNIIKPEEKGKDEKTAGK